VLAASITISDLRFTALSSPVVFFHPLGKAHNHPEIVKKSDKILKKKRLKGKMMPFF